MNSPALLYNKKLTDEAGVTIKDNMTIDEFEDICRTMLEKTGTRADLPYGAAGQLPSVYDARTGRDGAFQRAREKDEC